MLKADPHLSDGELELRVVFEQPADASDPASLVASKQQRPDERKRLRVIELQLGRRFFRVAVRIPVQVPAVFAAARAVHAVRKDVPEQDVATAEPTYVE